MCFCVFCNIVFGNVDWGRVCMHNWWSGLFFTSYGFFSLLKMAHFSFRAYPILEHCFINFSTTTNLPYNHNSNNKPPTTSTTNISSIHNKISKVCLMLDGVLPFGGSVDSGSMELYHLRGTRDTIVTLLSFGEAAGVCKSSSFMVLRGHGVFNHDDFYRLACSRKYAM